MIYNPFVFTPKGMYRLWKARRAGPASRHQAAELWLEFGTADAARLLDVDPIDLIYLVVAATDDT